MARKGREIERQRRAERQDQGPVQDTFWPLPNTPAELGIPSVFPPGLIQSKERVIEAGVKGFHVKMASLTEGYQLLMQECLDNWHPELGKLSEQYYDLVKEAFELNQKWLGTVAEMGEQLNDGSMEYSATEVVHKILGASRSLQLMLIGIHTEMAAIQVKARRLVTNEVLDKQVRGITSAYVPYTTGPNGSQVLAYLAMACTDFGVICAKHVHKAMGGHAASSQQQYWFLSYDPSEPNRVRDQLPWARGMEGYDTPLSLITKILRDQPVGKKMSDGTYLQLLELFKVVIGLDPERSLAVEKLETMFISILTQDESFTELVGVFTARERQLLKVAEPINNSLCQFMKVLVENLLDRNQTYHQLSWNFLSDLGVDGVSAPFEYLVMALTYYLVSLEQNDQLHIGEVLVALQNIARDTRASGSEEKSYLPLMESLIDELLVALKSSSIQSLLRMGDLETVFDRQSPKILCDRSLPHAQKLKVIRSAHSHGLVSWSISSAHLEYPLLGDQSYLAECELDTWTGNLHVMCWLYIDNEEAQSEDNRAVPVEGSVRKFSFVAQSSGDEWEVLPALLDAENFQDWTEERLQNMTESLVEWMYQASKKHLETQAQSLEEKLLQERQYLTSGTPGKKNGTKNQSHERTSKSSKGSKEPVAATGPAPTELTVALLEKSFLPRVLVETPQYTKMLSKLDKYERSKIERFFVDFNAGLITHDGVAKVVHHVSGPNREPIWRITCGDYRLIAVRVESDPKGQYRLCYVAKRSEVYRYNVYSSNVQSVIQAAERAGEA